MLLLLVLLLLVFNANSVSNDIIGKQSFITHTTWRRCLRRAKIYLFCACSKGVVWYIWCHSFDSYKRRKVIRNLILFLRCSSCSQASSACQTAASSALTTCSTNFALTPHNELLLILALKLQARTKTRTHTHKHTRMWSHSNTYSLSGHALSALSTCCGERERATHESQQHFELNANRSRAHYVKNVTNIIRSSWPIHELTSSSTSTSSPRCLRRRCSECAYVVKLLLLQLRVIFLLSCAEIARALSLSSLNLCLSSMALSPFQKTCLSCTNTLSHTFRSLSPTLSLSVCRAQFG